MQKGAEAEAKFLVYAFQQNWEVCKPFHHSQAYDFCIRRDKGEKWLTVQVKAAYRHQNKRQKQVRATVRRFSQPYKKGDFDLLFISHPDGSAFFIPYEAVADIKHSIDISCDKYQQFIICPHPGKSPQGSP